MSTLLTTPAETAATTPGLGYATFHAGNFTFKREQYFAHILYPGGRHIMPIDEFLRALMRDVAWGFFYGTVNFDAVFGTVNHYGTVELYAGLFNAAYRQAGRPLLVDSGTYACHTQKKWRDYFRGTSAHNTVRVDMLDQSVSGGNFLWLEHARANVERFESSPERDTLIAVAHWL